ncbi:MAG: hypothetical protein HUJ66_01255 [Oscillospiraceae bacterium]|nr:hypothetical protein [Oscillospiraceae bacterium]
MSVWEKGKRGMLFTSGREATGTAAEEAEKCENFSRDYEEECFAFEDVSCYNCRYRRWTRDSFECMNREKMI